jgi:hypothetical protein
MNLYSIICSICCFFSRIWFYIIRPEPPPLFKPKRMPQAQTFLAQINQRRLRKRQRQAARSGDRFAFA